VWLPSGLYRAEVMLDRLAPPAHLLRMLVEPALHSNSVNEQAGRL